MPPAVAPGILPADAPAHPEEATPAAPSAAAPEKPLARPASVLPPTDRKNPVAVALAEAQRTGTRVHIADQDTENDTTWANPDGTLTTDVSAGPVRVRQGSGFVPVDPTLVVQGGAVAPKAAKGNMRLSGGGKASDLAAVGPAGSRLAMRWPDALPAPTLSGDTATYHDVVTGGDLVVKALTTGYEVSLVLRARPETAPVIRLPLGLDGLGLVQEQTGRLRLTDTDGKEVASSAPPVMFSAERDPQADEPTQTTVVPTTIETGEGGPELVLHPDPAFLADPATVYPVTIDPAGTLGANLSNYVASDYPNQNYDGDPLIKVGTYNGGATVDRSFIKFNDALIKGTQVTSGVLHLYETWAYSCNAAAMWVDGAGVFGPGTTWNTQPWVDGRHWYSGSFAGGYSGCPETAGWKDLDITGLVQAWQPGGPGEDALALLAPNESDSYQWKKFSSVNTTTAPYISVTYESNAVPGAPQYVTAYPGNAQATITWSPPAFMGSPSLDSYYLFNYVLANNTWNYVGSQAACASCTSAVVTGLTNGATYLTYVYSHNSVGWGGYGYAVYTPAAPPSPPQAAVANGANGGASVRWAPPASNGGVAVDAYLVAAYDSIGLHNYQVVCGTCTYTPYTAGLVNGVGYSIYVFAHNGPGGWGNPVLANVITPGPTDPMAGAGERREFTMQTFPLTDRMTAKVNVGTGNLEVAVTDLVLPTVGGSLPIGHVYNSLAPNAGSTANYSDGLGYDWALNQAPDLRLVPNPDSSMVLHSSSSNAATFARNADGSYATPAGEDATLVRNADGTFTLSYHASAEVLRFGADGNLLSDADRNHNTVTLTYPDGRRETTITGTAGSWPGNTVTLTYGSASGHVTRMDQTADGATRSVTFSYEASGIAVLGVTDAAGGNTTYGYDNLFNLISITDPAGRVTQFTYDATHRITSLTRVVPGGTNAVTRYDYSVPGHTKVTDADGHPPTDYTVDGSGRVTAVTDAKGKSASTTYTPDAKVGSATNASGGITTNTFGANNGESLTQSQGPMGAVVSATYSTPGQPYLPDSVSDTMGNKSTFTYSGPGNLASTANAMAATAKLTYNGDGTVATATDPGGGVTTYGYNGVHQLTSITPPAGTSLRPQSFTYDGAGRRKTEVSGKGVTTTYSYDALDRTTGETHSDGTAAVSYGYDAAGNLTSRSDASGSTTYAYDVANQLTRKTLPGGAVLSYTYDPVGNLTSATDAGGTTTYHYDKTNLVDQITEPGGRTDVFAYDADHRRTDTWGATNGPVAYDATGNNVIPPTGFALHIKSTFDKAGNLTGLKSTRASSDATRVGDLSYAYTVPVGTTCAGATAGRSTALRQSVTDNMTGATTSYCYDGGGRLTRAATGGGATYAYGYDLNGNRISGPEGGHTFNAANQATDASSAYDFNGNLTASTAFPTLAYNGMDQATSITASGQSATAMAYAGISNAERTSAGPTTYQNGLLGVQTQTTTTCSLLLCGPTTSTFVRDPQGTLVAERIGADEYYYVFDGIGSVVALVDGNGTQRASYTYDPFGGHATATALNGALPDNPWRYAGGALDTTGLYHLGQRYYDPNLGRWTQQDSVVALGDPANGNRYVYVGDDPVNFVDLDGLKKKSAGKNCAVEGAIGGVAGGITGFTTIGLVTVVTGGVGDAVLLGAAGAIEGGTLAGCFKGVASAINKH